MINETGDNNTSKKSDGSSIQINIHSREELNEKSSSNDQHKFKSLVLTMTALKDEQKVPKFFFVYHSTSSNNLFSDRI